MFGNTRRIAQAIGDGLSAFTDVRIEPASAGSDPASAELVVIGAPTHAHTLPRASSREDAAKWAADPEQHLVLDPEASGPGAESGSMRSGLRRRHGPLSARAWTSQRYLAGDASAGIERRIRRLNAPSGRRLRMLPLVTTKNALVDGELDGAN